MRQLAVITAKVKQITCCSSFPVFFLKTGKISTHLLMTRISPESANYLWPSPCPAHQLGQAWKAFRVPGSNQAVLQRHRVGSWIRPLATRQGRLFASKEKVALDVFSGLFKKVVEKANSLASSCGGAKWNGFRLVAIDGTKKNVPYSEELAQTLGVPHGVHYPQLLSWAHYARSRGENSVPLKNKTQLRLGGNYKTLW